MGAYQDLTGNRFGKLTVLQKAEDKIYKSGRKQTMWLCICDCGEEIIVQANNLKSGHTISCGCARADAGICKRSDLSGEKFNRLTVLRETIPHGRERCWVCKCDCGKETIVQQNNLVSGLVKSCGCYRHDVLVREHTTHGGRRTRLYNIWAKMIQRCSKEYDASYSIYGARGITVCKEWASSFEEFRDWSLSHGYNEDLSIDRIDNNKGYSPDNCRWADAKTQARNRRSNVNITIGGETKTLTEWAEIRGIDPRKVYNRINKLNWKPEEALSELGDGRSTRWEKGRG